MKPSYSFRGGWGGRRKEGGWAGGCWLRDAHLLGGSCALPVNQVQRRQPRAGKEEEVAPARGKAREGRSRWGGKTGKMCVVCDFNVVLGRQGGQAGILLNFFLLLHPTPSMGSGSSWCPSLLFSCPDSGPLAWSGRSWPIHLAEPFWGRGRRDPPFGGGQRVRLVCC